MNILPKKRWHVRTKENIARVRKDEAEAAEKEKQENLRIERAEREARLIALKKKNRQNIPGLDNPPDNIKKTEAQQHINFFSDFEHAVQSTNKDHDKEVKAKKEEYEKKIGYLTYLGQDTNEALGKKNWYEVPPGVSHSINIKDTYEKLVLRDDDGKLKEKRIDEKNGEIAWKAKQNLDPLNIIKQYSSKIHKDKDNNTKQKIITDMKKKSKHKSPDDHRNGTKEKLQKLREARLKREQHEQQKTKMFLSRLSGTASEESNTNIVKKIQPKYNSQFNPELARQNYRNF